MFVATDVSARLHSRRSSRQTQRQVSGSNGRLAWPLPDKSSAIGDVRLSTRQRPLNDSDRPFVACQLRTASPCINQWVNSTRCDQSPSASRLTDLWGDGDVRVFRAKADRNRAAGAGRMDTAGDRCIQGAAWDGAASTAMEMYLLTVSGSRRRVASSGVVQSTRR